MRDESKGFKGMTFSTRFEIQIVMIAERESLLRATSPAESDLPTRPGKPRGGSVPGKHDFWRFRAPDIKIGGQFLLQIRKLETPCSNPE